MFNASLFEKLTEVFRDVFSDDELEISSGTTAQDIEDWDSLIHIRLILSVEKEFGIRFSTAELAQFDNVGQLADLVSEKVSAKE